MIETLKSSICTCYFSSLLFPHFKPESNSMELTLFHSSDWKADGPVQITPLERMIADVEKKKCGSEKPVIVMCE